MWMQSKVYAGRLIKEPTQSRQEKVVALGKAGTGEGS